MTSNLQEPYIAKYDWLTGRERRKGEALREPHIAPASITKYGPVSGSLAITTGQSGFGRPTGDWDLIHGELVTFTDPQRDLPPIDQLEGFRPGGHSMYQRVMVAVLCGRTSIPAWTYWMPRFDNGTRIGTGVWHRA